MAGAHGIGPSFQANPFLREIPRTSFFLAKPVMAAAATAVCFLIIWGMPNTQEILGQTSDDSVRFPSLLPGLNWTPTAIWSFALAALFCLSIMMLDVSTRFLYFQF